MMNEITNGHVKFFNLAILIPSFRFILSNPSWHVFLITLYMGHKWFLLILKPETLRSIRINFQLPTSHSHIDDYYYSLTYKSKDKT